MNEYMRLMIGQNQLGRLTNLDSATIARRISLGVITPDAWTLQGGPLWEAEKLPALKAILAPEPLSIATESEVLA